jgi:hypothetical protein
MYNKSIAFGKECCHNKKRRDDRGQIVPVFKEKSEI